MIGNELLKLFLEEVNNTYYSFFKVTEAGVEAKEANTGIDRVYKRELIEELIKSVVKRGKL